MEWSDRMKRKHGMGGSALLGLPRRRGLVLPAMLVLVVGIVGGVLFVPSGDGAVADPGESLSARMVRAQEEQADSLRSIASELRKIRHELEKVGR